MITVFYARVLYRCRGCSARRMFPAEQERLGVLGGPARAADVDVRPDVLLPGQDAGATWSAGLLQGQLLQHLRHPAHALGHQPGAGVAGAAPVAAFRAHAQRDRPPVAAAPVPARPNVRQHVRCGRVLVGHRLQAGHHRDEHTAKVPGPILSVLHCVHGAHRVHKLGRRLVRGHATVLRGHQQVSS